MKSTRELEIWWIIPLLTAVCLMGIPAYAKYGGGSGTAEDPYKIATAADLIALGESPEDYDKHFILTADIDLDPNLPGRKVFDKAVIATFTGVFDGNDHRITNLSIDDGGARNDFLGLLGCLGAASQVKNLQMENVNLRGQKGDQVGGLVAVNYGAMTDCYATGSVSGKYYVGGLVGSNWGNVTNCYSTGLVSGGEGRDGSGMRTTRLSETFSVSVQVKYPFLPFTLPSGRSLAWHLSPITFYIHSCYFSLACSVQTRHTSSQRNTLD